jgi:pimeloyl-ACP methyl ester carboxylesterase
MKKGLVSIAFSILAGCSAVERGGSGKNLVVGIEGLGGGVGYYNIHDLSRDISNNVHVVYSASSGDWGSHLDIIKKKAEAREKIILIGFSSGASEVVYLAKKCKEQGIKITGLFLLDPTYVGRPLPPKIPENVETVLCYRTGDEIACQRYLGENDFDSKNVRYKNIVDFEGISHLELPRVSERRIVKDILEIVNDNN